jgi:hypothetical protein
MTNFLQNVDVKLLREQREALLSSIDELDGHADPDGTGKHIDLLDGLVNMLDDILDEIEIENFSRPPEMAQHPLWEKD